MLLYGCSCNFSFHRAITLRVASCLFFLSLFIVLNEHRSRMPYIFDQNVQIIEEAVKCTPTLSVSRMRRERDVSYTFEW